MIHGLEWKDPEFKIMPSLESFCFITFLHSLACPFHTQKVFLQVIDDRL